jgi:thiol-disulfide isomerase/thioredoxin
VNLNLYVIGSLVTILVLATSARWLWPGRLQLPVWLGAGSVGLLLGISLTLATLTLFGYLSPQAPKFLIVDASKMMPTTPEIVETRPPMAVGTSVPPLRAAGWTNGPPPPLDGGRVHVLDIWGQWCPVCRETAPNLVQVHEEFADKGVSFVSITSDPQVVVESYVEDFQARWPHGYGASLEMIDALGARETGQPTPGYDVRPTLYVVDGNGKVLWCDEHLRYLHQPPELIQAALEQALEKALAASE